MLAEYLSNAEWQIVMPGVQACTFSVSDADRNFPINLPINTQSMHFEALFCRSGSLVLKCGQTSSICIGEEDVLLLSDFSELSRAQITAPLEGVCIAVEGTDARQSLAQLFQMMGLNLYTEQAVQLLAQKGGYLRVGSTLWSRTLFLALDNLPPAEQGRYCLLKSIELLYLLCTQDRMLNSSSVTCNYLTRTVMEMQDYMEQHLDEKLTITDMSRRFHISPTAFKSCFRELYDQPVHSWLQTKRMQQAADFLLSTPMTVLQIAQAVGYEGVSQFNVAFKRRYGVTPSYYRKMSGPGIS